MRWRTVSFILVGFCLFLNPTKPAKGAPANLFLNSPSISTIPVGQALHLRLLTDADGTTFVKWKIESTGRVVILGWIGSTSATGCPTWQFCLYSSSTEPNVYYRTLPKTQPAFPINTLLYTRSPAREATIKRSV
jgi:hypothetical protein